MKDHWLKDIHDRMADFETKEPDGLWDRIEEAMPKHRNHSFLLMSKVWMRRTAGIAAMIAIALVVYMSMPRHDNIDMEIPQPKAPQDLFSDNDKNTKTVNEITKPESPDLAVKILEPNKIRTENTPEEKLDITIENDWPHENITNPTDTLPESTPVPTENNTAPKNKKTLNDRPLYAHATSKKELKGGRFSVSAFTSGGTNLSINHHTNTVMQSHGFEYYSDANWEDSPMLGILLFNKDRTTTTDVQHRLPVKTGLTFAYRLNDRVSLESGVVYTNLTSDLKFGGDRHYLSGRQTLHYIGIPVNVRYRAFTWKKIDIYAAAGIQGEKCVSGKTVKDYILDNQDPKPDSEKITIKPLQWSISASAGAQFNIVKTVGIYAEPGLSYYFDNGTEVKTIYKDRPLNFNVNLGLRFTFGK